jgi:hypothetical protein
MRLGGAQNWSRHFGEEKNLLPMPGIKPWFLSNTAHSPITVLTLICVSKEIQAMCCYKLQVNCSYHNRKKADALYMCHTKKYYTHAAETYKTWLHSILHCSTWYKYLKGRRYKAEM